MMWRERYLEEARPGWTRQDGQQAVFLSRRGRRMCIDGQTMGFMTTMLGTYRYHLTRFIDSAGYIGVPTASSLSLYIVQNCLLHLRQHRLRRMRRSSSTLTRAAAKYEAFSTKRSIAPGKERGRRAAVLKLRSPRTTARAGWNEGFGSLATIRHDSWPQPTYDLGAREGLQNLLLSKGTACGPPSRREIRVHSGLQVVPFPEAAGLTRAAEEPRRLWRALLLDQF